MNPRITRTLLMLEPNLESSGIPSDQSHQRSWLGHESLFDTHMRNLVKNPDIIGHVCEA
jgi:hypothetical protein